MLVLCLFACSASDKNADIVNKTSPIPKIEDVRLPNADGIMVFYDDLITIDYSNSDEGYFMVKTNTSDHRRLKLSVSKDDMTYNYDINKEQCRSCVKRKNGTDPKLRIALTSKEDCKCIEHII